jgi:hypothetical protein
MACDSWKETTEVVTTPSFPYQNNLPTRIASPDMPTSSTPEVPRKTRMLCPRDISAAHSLDRSAASNGTADWLVCSPETDWLRSPSRDTNPSEIRMAPVQKNPSLNWVYVFQCRNKPVTATPIPATSEKMTALTTMRRIGFFMAFPVVREDDYRLDFSMKRAHCPGHRLK